MADGVTIDQLVSSSGMSTGDLIPILKSGQTTATSMAFQVFRASDRFLTLASTIGGGDIIPIIQNGNQRVATAMLLGSGLTQNVNTFVQSGIGSLVPVARSIQAKGREIVTSADFTGSSGLVGIGPGVLAATTTGISNVAIGDSTLGHNTTGSNNIAIGPNAMLSNTTGDAQLAIGINSLTTNTTGRANVAVGHSTLNANTTGHDNVAVGVEALLSNTTGQLNTAIGQAAMRLNVSGLSNVAVGNNALPVSQTGDENVAIGSNCLEAANGASFNTAVGYHALDAVVTGASNTAVGLAAGVATTGSNNVFIGANAGQNATTGSNVICVGQNSQPSAVGVSNEVTIGNASITNNRLFGTVTLTGDLVTAATKKLLFNGAGGNAYIVETSANQVDFFGGGNNFLRADATTVKIGPSVPVVTVDLSSNLVTLKASVTAYSATAIPAGGTTGSGVLVSSTANFGMFFGSGAPTLSAAKGSLYLRSDGSGTTDRAYINTNGSTTWTALTTVA